MKTTSPPFSTFEPSSFNNLFSSLSHFVLPTPKAIRVNMLRFFIAEAKHSEASVNEISVQLKLLNERLSIQKNICKTTQELSSEEMGMLFLNSEHLGGLVYHKLEKCLHSLIASEGVADDALAIKIQLENGVIKLLLYVNACEQRILSSEELANLLGE